MNEHNGKGEENTLSLRIAKRLRVHENSQKRHEDQKFFLNHYNDGMSTDKSQGTEIVYKASGENQLIQCIYEGRTDHCFEVICGKRYNWA